MHYRYIQRRKGLISALVFLALAQAACVAPASRPNKSAAVDLEAAMQSYAQADSYSSLRGAIDQLILYAAQNLDDYASRARLANAYTLLGAAYLKDPSQKETAYQKAREWAEAAMLTEPGFAHLRLERGVAFPLALQQLDERHLEAMEFWKTALFYEFRECAGPLDKLLRYNRLRSAVAVMQRIEQIDPQAMWGNNLFSKGMFYLSQPENIGGDMHKAAAYLAEAAAVSKRNIVPRWGRAKYFAVATKDRRLFRRDLKWVAAQPLDKLVGYRPWNLALQKEARELLTRTDQLFEAGG